MTMHPPKGIARSAIRDESTCRGRSRSRRSAVKAHEIVCAVDWGTTYSGVAWTNKSTPDTGNQIPVIRDYDGGRNADKAPSHLRYKITNSRKRKSVGADVEVQTKVKVAEWGFMVDKEKEYLQMIKLLLDKHQDWPPFVPRQEMETQLEKYGKTPIQAAADYLKELKDHIFSVLERHVGETLFSTTKIQFVLTVPALWSDTARNATLQAAEQAGFGESASFSMVTEPEAAALYALRQMKNLNLTRGDNYIVCDAGGGTVDLISYAVISVSPLRLEESAPGSGGICGSGLLNIRFEEHVRARMGTTAFLEYRKQNSMSWNSCMKQFELFTKREYDPLGLPFKEHYLSLAGAKDSPTARIFNNHITLSTADLEDIFHPIIKSIIKLADDQHNTLVRIRKRCNGLILVGGFGESIHLHNCLKAHFADVIGFEVIQPAQAWSAVARGAVIHSIEGHNIIQSRIVKHHYGVVMRQYWDPKKHSRKNKVHDADDDLWYADNQIEWYVTKNQSLPCGDAILMPFHFTNDTGEFTDTITLVVSDEEEPPDEFEKSPLTRVLCTIDPDASDIPTRKWKKHTTDSGKVYRQLEYKVGMKFEAAEILFDMRVDKTIYGTATANYE